jgi:UDP-glucose 4-epimerase
VVHLAAAGSVVDSVADPFTNFDVNARGTLTVLDAARRAGVERVVVASTGGALVGNAPGPVDESSVPRPLSPYGAGKAAAESYLELFRRLHGLSTLSLRLANVYGPRQDPHGEAGVVAIFCGAAAENHPVTIYGDGRQTRDYIYVADVVEAFTAAGRAGIDGVMNISTGRETAVADLADRLGLERRFAPHRPGEVARSCLDPALAAARLDWRAETTLAEGLERTLRAVERPRGRA